MKKWSLNKLFLRRLLDDARAQYKVIAVVIDWIIMLYIVVPVVLILASVHVQLWQITLPNWVVNMPFQYTTFIFVLVTILGSLILRLEAADVLFIKQHTKVMNGLKRYGLLYSLLIQGLVIGIILFYLSPIFVRVYGMNVIAIIQLFLVMYLLKSIYMILANLIQVCIKGWRNKVILFILTPATIGVYWLWLNFMRNQYFILFALSLVLLLGFMSWYRLTKVDRFEAELDEDQRIKGKLTAFLVTQAVGKPRKLRTKPTLFKKSNKLFKLRSPENRLAEIMIKSFIRGEGFKTYLQMSALAFITTIMSPSPINILIALFILFLFVSFIEANRRAFTRRSLMEIIPMTDTIRNYSYFSSRGVLQGLLLLPMYCIAAGLLISMIGWWGILVAVPMSLALTFIVSRAYLRLS
ncbi:ABC transporter permease [Paenibacillus turicensis]|uniref:ABC transporter permease n=1 Tax=Paenibacillus turicensis TaxID=160487 RepID=UPI003D2DFBC5